MISNLVHVLYQATYLHCLAHIIEPFLTMLDQFVQTQLAKLQCQMFFSSVYQDMHVIWSTEDARTNWGFSTIDTTSFATLYVNTNNTAIKATVYIMVDDDACLHVNGAYIGMIHGMNFHEVGYGGKYDITLKPGPNSIRIDVKNNGTVMLAASVIANGAVLAHTDSTWTWTLA